MKIVGRDILEELCRKHPDTRKWVESWLADVGALIWISPIDLKASYASASFLADNVVIFNVLGNRFRLETAVAYRAGVVVVTWAGTHTEYDTRNKKRGRRK